MKTFPALAFAALCVTGDAFATTFIVDTGSDSSLVACDDATPADCSLRGAMENANLNPAPDRIVFAIPTSDASYQATTGHWRIAVGATPLPRIDNAVEIDGYTQPGAAPNTITADAGGLDTILKIEVMPGTTFGTQQNGFEISPNFPSQGASTFRGLALNSFAQQFQLWGTAAHRIEGCFLGTDIDGTVAAVTTSGGRGYGIFAFGAGA